MKIYDELVARGLIAQVTDEEEIRELVNNGKAVFYIGFDPTADSLHVGHFMALCLMKRLQEAGNKPIALIGGGTGMVGQRFVTLLENHPWFELTAIAASARSAGKTYEEAIGSRWALENPMPEEAKKMVVMNAESDIEAIASQVDFVFSAVDMKKEEIQALEEAYAKHECPVVSNNSAHRWTPDVPMVVPEINPEHIRVIEAQRKRLGVQRGFIAVKSNCSLQSYVPALHPLREFGLEQVLVCTYQAISGAGKTFATWPDMVDNVIPYIGGEEEKSEQEPLRLWGRIVDGVFHKGYGAVLQV